MVATGPTTRPVGRREALAVLGAALGFMLLTCVPYLIAAQPGFAGPDLHFQGFLWGVDDGNVYRMYIRQCAEGAWFLRDQYTLEPQEPRFFNLFFLVLGWVTRLSGLPIAVVYHLARVVGGVLLLYAFYLLAAEIGLGRRARVGALLLAGFSSGLGWIVYLGVTSGGIAPELGQRLAPIDLAAGWQAVPEAVTFLTLLLNPLFIAGTALMCLALLWGIRGARPEQPRAVVVSGLALLLLGNVHTYSVFVIYLLLLVWFGLQAAAGHLSWRQAVGRYAVLGLLGLPAIAWQYWVQTVDPIWAAKGAVPKASPAVSGYVLGYGLVLALAAGGAVLALRQARVARMRGAGLPDTLVPVLWMVLGFALVYSPLLFQRKLAEGLHLPLCLLGGLALARLAARAAPRVSWGTLLAAVVVLTLPSNLFFVADCLGHMRTNNRALLHVLMPPAYLTGDERAGMRRLGELSTSADRVMSSNLTGNHLPAYAPAHVMVGHWDETLDFRRYLGLAHRFYSPLSSPAERRRVLREQGITLVWYGPQEQLLQQAFGGTGMAPGVPAGLEDHLRPIFRHGEVTLYRVIGRP